MISVSNKWKEYAKSNASFSPSGSLNYSSGTSGYVLWMDLTAEDFMEGSVRFTDSISDTDKLTMGSVITNTCNFALNNATGKFNDVKDWISIELKFTAYYPDGTSETINRGVYNLDTPSVLGRTIECEGFDNMDLLNKRFINKIGRSWGLSPTIRTITYPVSLRELFEGLVDYCSTADRQLYKSYEAADYGYTTAEFEYNESTTCRDVIGWIAETMGAYARADESGTICMKTFRSEGWTQVSSLDGGTISPWSSGSPVDGSTIDPWRDGVDYIGGMIAGNAYELYGIKTSAVSSSELVLNKIEAYAYNTVDEPVVGVVGSGDYALRIRDNPLVTSDNAWLVAYRTSNGIGGLDGFQFTPFTMNIFGDPSIEAGDEVLVTDYLGNAHHSVITDLTYSIGDMQLSCDAQPEEENNLYYGNEQTDTVARAVSISSQNLQDEIPNITSEAYEYTYDNLPDVVEEEYHTATSGYRKWKSGVMECWMTLSVSLSSVESVSPLYYGVINLDSYLYPAQFNSAPTVSVNMYTATRGYWSDLGTNGTATHPPKVRVYTVNNSTANCTLHIHAVGTWK